MTVRRAVDGDLRALPKALHRCGLAETARALAGRLDDTESARDAAAVAKELRAVLTELREMAKQAPREVDPVDDLDKRRAARRVNASVSDGAAGGDVRRPGGR